MKRAVLTADIVNSTRLTPANEKKLLTALRRVLSPYPFEFYRGDSFQAWLAEPAQALRLALLCRAAAIGLVPESEDTGSDLRIAIGIGEAEKPGKALGIAKGEAFLLSGRAFDQISREATRLAIATADPLANAALQVIASYANAIFGEMTGKQAEVIFELLNGQNQQDSAIKLKKSKSTISQRVNAGRWPEIETMMAQYQNIIKHLS